MYFILSNLQSEVKNGTCFWQINYKICKYTCTYVQLVQYKCLLMSHQFINLSTSFYPEHNETTCIHLNKIEIYNLSIVPKTMHDYVMKYLASEIGHINPKLYRQLIYINM